MVFLFLAAAEFRRRFAKGKRPASRPNCGSLSALVVYSLKASRNFSALRHAYPFRRAVHAVSTANFRRGVARENAGCPAHSASAVSPRIFIRRDSHPDGLATAASMDSRTDSRNFPPPCDDHRKSNPAASRFADSGQLPPALRIVEP